MELADRHALLGLDRLEADVGVHLRRLGDVFATIERHDSGNTSWGLRIGDERWFVKASGSAEGVRWLESAERFHAAVQHDAIVPLRRLVPVEGGGWAVVYPWCAGEILNDPFAPGASPRAEPGSAYRRFRGLEVGELYRALDVVLDAHRAVAAAGFVAVDFYDGSLLYAFDSAELRLVDLDLYRPGPYVLEAERQFGSTRFMAPEEFRRGAAIDERTTVFTLGRTAFVFLSADEGGAEERSLWRGSEARWRVARTATAGDPRDRYATVAELADSWSRASG